MYYFKVFTCSNSAVIEKEMSKWISEHPNIEICSVAITKGAMADYTILVTYNNA